MYILTAIASLLGAGLFALRGLRLDPNLAIAPMWAGIAIMAGWLARRAHFPRSAAILESTGLVYGQAFAFLFVIYALMTFDIRLADASLARVDRLIGFYWPDLAERFRRNDELTMSAKIVYMSFNWEPALITISLPLAGLARRSWQFVSAATISLCITAMLGPLLPADGTVVYFHTGVWPKLANAWHQSQVIHALRSGGHFIDGRMLTGVISFPSFHACSAVLFSWAIWPLRYLRWPVIVLNIAMAFCAIVIGAHYLIDILAGIIVAIIALGLTAKYADPQLRSLDSVD